MSSVLLAWQHERVLLVWHAHNAMRPRAGQRASEMDKDSSIHTLSLGLCLSRGRSLPGIRSTSLPAKLGSLHLYQPCTDSVHLTH